MLIQYNKYDHRRKTYEKIAARRVDTQHGLGLGHGVRGGKVRAVSARARTGDGQPGGVGAEDLRAGADLRGSDVCEEVLDVLEDVVPGCRGQELVVRRDEGAAAREDAL